MKVIDAIMSRRSVREFRDKEVPFEHLMDIIEAGLWAPSPGNLQNVRVIMVRSPKVKQVIADACLGQQWMVMAPCLFVVCNDPADVVKAFPELGAKLASQSVCASIMNMLLAAEELKLGSCWVGAFDDFALKRDLSIPDYVSVEGVVAVGYANESPKSSRLSPELITFFDAWGTRTSKRKGIVESMKHSLKKKLSMNKKGFLP